MIEIGRVCIKTAGRDAAKKCVIIDILDNKFVLIDGETRRRKCNILHLEPLKDVIKIKKNASHDEVKKEFGKLGLKSKEKKKEENVWTDKRAEGREEKIRGHVWVKEKGSEKGRDWEGEGEQLGRKSWFDWGEERRR